MFIFGLVIGPALGLVAADGLARTRLGGPLSAVVVGLVLIFLLFAGFINLELKLGLLAGILLGFLLAFTPFPIQTAGASDGGEDDQAPSRA